MTIREFRQDGWHAPEYYALEGDYLDLIADRNRHIARERAHTRLILVAVAAVFIGAVVGNTATAWMTASNAARLEAGE